MAFASNAQQLPRSLFLHGVELVDEFAINGGGYADIFQARYQGQLVALKRLRSFEDTVLGEKSKAVSSVIAM